MSPAFEIVFSGRKVGMAILHITELSGNEIIPTGPPYIIAVFFKYSVKIGFTPIMMQHMVHGSMTPDMGIPAGHEAATGRDTYRILAKGICERHRLCLNKPVEIGGCPGPVSQMPQGIGPHLVRVKQEDVGSFFHDPFISSL